MEFIKVIGRGAYGIVILGKDKISNKSFAIKALRQGQDVSLNGNLIELDILTKLSDHPNVLTLKQIAIENPFVVDIEIFLKVKLEKLFFFFDNAESDLSLIIKKNKLTFLEKKKTIKGILDGLEYIHLKGIIHRDIKPKNILMFKGNFPKICDFGIAKFKCNNVTNTPRICTRNYVPPEVLLKLPYDQKMDIWSIGVVIYELFNGYNFIQEKEENQLEGIISRIPTQEMTKKMCEIIVKKMIKKDIKRESRILNKKLLKKYEKELGDSVVFENFMSNVLKIDPLLRYNCAQCLDHVFFINEPRQRCTKNKCHRKFDIILNQFRSDGIKYIINNFYASSEIKCMLRIIFHAIELFDRFMLAHEKDTTELDVVILAANMCVYISVKFFSTMHKIQNADKFFNIKFTKDIIKIMETAETNFITNTLKYNIYEPTLFETADEFGIILNEDYAEKLLYLMLNKNINGKRHTEIFKYFATKLADKLAEDMEDAKICL